MALDLLWRRRPAGGFAARDDQNIAGETPAPRKACVRCQFDDLRCDAVGSEERGTILLHERIA
jgi:hypothetical protein